MTRWLYRYETKGIQSWILGTGKLVEIAGGSELIEQLSDDARNRIEEVGGVVKLAAAGSVTAEFSSKEQLEKFAAEWLLCCARRAPSLSVIQAWVEVASDDAESKKAMKPLIERLSEARQRPLASLPVAGPLVARSPRSGLPEVPVDGQGDDARRLDAIASAQRRANKGKADGVFTRALPEDKRMFFPVKDFEDFGEEYMAVVHADGNGIGQIFMSEKLSLEDKAKLSSALRKCTEAAAQTAARELIARGGLLDSNHLAMRPIVLGGDDYTVVVRARDAIPFTESFLRAFEDQTSKRVDPVHHHGRGFSACAGIAIVKPGFPFVRAYELAEELCKHCKRHTARDKHGRKTSALTFHRVTTAAVRSYDEILSDELRAAGGGSLAWGHWTVGDGETIDALYHLAVELDTTSRGAVREWLTLAAMDAANAARHWTRVRDVLQLRGRKSPLDAPLEKLGVDPKSLWSSDAEKRTPIGDALTLFSISKGYPESWTKQPSNELGRKGGA